MPKAIRDVYGDYLAELGALNKDIVVLDSDLSSSTKSGVFGKAFPDRFFNVGIAEAQMAGMAAGFAKSGKIPFINTFTAFMMLRAGDPIRSLIAYDKLNVKVAGAYAGMSDAYDGASHHALIDIGFFRSLPNFIVLVASDAMETKKILDASIEIKGPVYIRLSRAATPEIFGPDYDFKAGKGVLYRGGNDVTLIGTGKMFSECITAAEILAKDGISARVINMHTIKPIDKEIIENAAKETGAIVTAEEHSIFCGLGSAVSEVLTETTPVPIERVGTKDTFAESGDYNAILEKYGLTAKHIVNAAIDVLKRKK
jgi:transketolase